MAESQQPIAKRRLQALLNLLLQRVTDEELQQMQQQIDQLEARRVAAGHHDHNHPDRDDDHYHPGSDDDPQSAFGDQPMINFARR
jgi:hypothetical protein